MYKLYPEIQPYQVHHLEVSKLHTIYVEECGNPDGEPVIFLHGGPGGGLNDSYRQYFHPEKWRIILFDQRGCGQSTPFAELRENTTQDLIADMEKIRKKLNIKKWWIFGGSWGSYLALAYAIEHAKACSGLLLRGIFMLRKKELTWFYQEGASRLFPDAWEKYIEVIPKEERGNLIEAFHKKLTGKNLEERKRAAKAWSQWEASTSKLIPSKGLIENFGGDEFSQAFARIECHYFMNNGFYEEEEYILNHIDKIRHLPCLIVQGRYDIVCPAESAWELSKAWPQAEIQIIDNAGHSLSEEGITNRLIQETNKIVGV